MPALGVILAFLNSATARIFGEKLLVWLAFKGFMVFLFLTVAPILLNNVIYDLIDNMKTFMATQSGGATGFNGAMAFTGLLAWLLECFRISECVAVLVSA